MLRLHYTGDWVLIADEVGEALVAYARALAEAKTAAVIVVPVVAADGQVQNAEFLLGPASQLYLTQAEEVAHAEEADREVVRELQRRTRNLQTTMTFSSEPGAAEAPFDHDAS
ncbi:MULTISPECIES: hypothetical protein [unclassified Microbacterium]|uniref:hypothetical protein n=1 Tax=unclassified Microbacterium TaxID=2609290 RepID=UPI00214B3908|nr:MULTISPECIES: hypothetical protein [unclassified Microbacterium]MCR2809734.1 hypothetical protein [Microbacterium sp. zg.B185]WIM17951.1 hypothetical protein QNO12_10020 [Microbacterium sp. zg-B185]